MSLEPGPAQTSASPLSSGRSSPGPRHARAHAEDELHKKDKSYRRYASGVERALSLFDTALQEWADYIAFLGRLLKAVQAHPTHIATVPFKSIVAKRLAQCLVPSLPSGVHQKALEVYSYIFELIGTQALSLDLHLYLPGLTPTLSFASLAVRPAFLSLLENHVLRVHPSALRPALRAILLALFPGLEEATSEEFDRTLSILDAVKKSINNSSQVDAEVDNGVGDEYFWQCFFLASITSSSRRQGALAFLVRRLPQLAGQPQQSRDAPNGHQQSVPISAQIEAVISPEPGLLIRCLAAGLADDQLLVQRGFLDLLVTNCPLHSLVLQERVQVEDLERLITAAVGVVTRKDMSLNRRLWTWILGPDPASRVDGGDAPGATASPTNGAMTPGGAMGLARTRYFREYGLSHLISGIQRMIDRNDKLPADRARPFRICLSLMDRWEVGGLVIPAVLLPALESVRQYEKIATSKDSFQDVVRSASVFFDGVESGLIWGELVGLLAAAFKNPSFDQQSRLDKLALVHFIIIHFNIREEEMLVVHIPMVALALLTMLEDDEDLVHLEHQTRAFPQLADRAFAIAETLVEMIPERAFWASSTPDGTFPSGRQREKVALQNEEILRTVRVFYERDQGNLDVSGPPFSASDAGELLLHKSSKLVDNFFHSQTSKVNLDSRTKSCIILLRKVPRTDLSVDRKLFGTFQDTLSHASSVDGSMLPFPIFAALVSVITALAKTSATDSDYLPVQKQLSDLASPLVRQAWLHLSPSQPKYHVEAVRCMWQIQSIMVADDHNVEAAISALMIENDTHGTFSVRSALPGRKLGILWTHTVALQGGISDVGGTSQQRSREGHKGRVEGRHNYEIMLTRPLFLLLDALDDDGSELYTFVISWLQALPSLDRVFHLVLRKLLSFDMLKPTSIPQSVEAAKSPQAEEDVRTCMYYLRTLSNILRWSTARTWSSLASEISEIEDLDVRLRSECGFDDGSSLQDIFTRICMRALQFGRVTDQAATKTDASKLHRIVLAVLQQILTNPSSGPLSRLELEDQLLDTLLVSLESTDCLVQIPLFDAVYATLKLRTMRENPPRPQDHERTASRDTMKSIRPSLSMERGEKDLQSSNSISPPPKLVACLQGGFSSPNSRPMLDSWTRFLTDCMPLYSETIFQVLLPLVETLCLQISRTFEALQATFELSLTEEAVAPEASLIALLNALEQILAKAHDRLIMDEVRFASVKSPEQPQGFFGNMVSGVFSSDLPATRQATANDRLTVLLSFKDTVRICFRVWSWGGIGSAGSKQDPASAASFNYTSLRTRNRARRLLEHLFAAETLECLETMVEIWRNSAGHAQGSGMASVFNLLHVLDGSRPRSTIPAIFNAIYSRDNPNALEPTSKSTLTSDLGDVEVVDFLAEYARSLEDDAMDEIWTDCMTFLRDVLANPFPHRQTLPKLLEFTAILGEKVDNTNFGEQRKMRRELSDLFVRLLAAIFTTKPMNFSQEQSPTSGPERGHHKGHRPDSITSRPLPRSDDVVTILVSVVPNLPKILSESDRVLGAATTISSSVIGPMFRSKSFPDNISPGVLDLVYHVARLPGTQKSWRKDIGDAFNNSKFFQTPVGLVETHWLPLLRQWTLGDKDRMPEVLSRLSAPTTAGIVFGVGASSARIEADRKAQLNLRRTAVLLLAAAEDTFVGNMPGIVEKVVELLTATAVSSPSSATRAEVYMVARALVLKCSAIHLSPLWPIMTSELQAALSTVFPGQDSDLYGDSSMLQACKLLDTLIVLAPDEFQLHEWLFITDTIDAVYRPSQWQPLALIDELSEELGTVAPASAPPSSMTADVSHKSPSRRPLLRQENIRDVPKAELLSRVLRPFFSQLSIYAFENTYSMGAPDWQACFAGLLADVFDESTIVGVQGHF